VRRPEEVLVVVYRRGISGAEFLVLERSPERQGYWHLVAGGLEAAEDAASAAARELHEETGLQAEVVELGFNYIYPLADEPPEVRARFAPEVAEIAITGFAAEAPPHWEPSIDEEHVAYRWCTADEAVQLLRYPEPRDAVRRVAERLAEAAA
jgi:8-oxo-dGTP pyrophosphatase MutT (NUDIX family)